MTSSLCILPDATRPRGNFVALPDADLEPKSLSSDATMSSEPHPLWTGIKPVGATHLWKTLTMKGNLKQMKTLMAFHYPVYRLLLFHHLLLLAPTVEVLDFIVQHHLYSPGFRGDTIISSRRKYTWKDLQTQGAIPADMLEDLGLLVADFDLESMELDQWVTIEPTTASSEEGAFFLHVWITDIGPIDFDRSLTREEYLHWKKVITGY